MDENKTAKTAKGGKDLSAGQAGPPADRQDTAAPAGPEKKPAAFPLGRLRRDCMKIFGVTTSTFDCAAFGLEGDFTVEEIRAKIKGLENTPIPKTPKTKKEE